MLKPESYSLLKYIVFCGEPLSQKLAEKWQDAAPNSIVDNLYGPTEATCAITYYTWKRDISPPECQNGIVPIGKPFDDQQIAIIDQNGNLVPNGSEGELCLSGSQVTDGYINNPEKTILELCKFSKIEFNKKMLYPREGEESSLTGKKRKGFDKKAAFRWKNVISPLEKKIVTFFTQNSMKRFGYDPIYHPIFRDDLD